MYQKKYGLTMEIALTGATGFIDSYLVDFLLD